MPNPYDNLSDAGSGDKKMGKGLLWSKTAWVNMLTAVVSLGTYFLDSDLLVNNPEVVGIGGAVIGGINIILRLLTKEPINSLKGKSVK